MTSKNKIICTIKDVKDRPLLILMRTKKDTMMHIFKRYRNMSDQDKDVIMTMWKQLASGQSGKTFSIGTESEMTDFLNFKDNRPCG